MTTLRHLFILLFFAVEVTQAASQTCNQARVLKEIYASLHDAITKYAVNDQDTQHLDLLPIGRILEYDKFDPGKKSRFATPGTLPLNVVENALPLVNKIFPTDPNVHTSPVNSSQSDKDYHFDSLSSAYNFVLNHLMVKPRNFSTEEKLRAKYYLQELVPNPELIIQNKTELPRYLLYDYYRSLYLSEKEYKENQMNFHRESLTQQGYENWGIQKLPTLESDSDAAFQKWMIFGYKTEVEQQLQYFDIDEQEDKLMSTRALFKSMAVYSKKDPHVQVYPFRFEPENWFQILKKKQLESADELRYQMSLLQAQQALMNATRNDLAKKTNNDVSNSLIKIKEVMAKLRERVRNAVDKLLQMEVDCFARVNLTVCANIINSHTAFRLLLDDVAQHYEQAAYLESILNGRAEAVSVLNQKLIEVAIGIKDLDSRISQAQDTETSELIDLTTGKLVDDAARATCFEAGKIQFRYQSLPSTDVTECLDDGDFQSKDGQKYCTDIRVPLNATQSSIWSVHSCAVDHDLKEFDDILSEFHNTMNTIETEISASLHKVSIQRPWLDQEILHDSEHFTMQRNRGIVSPGSVKPLNYFHQLAESGQYLMPQFTSSLILASNVTLFFPGLGSWRDEEADIDNHTNAIIHILMKYAYASTLEGGYGPFSLAPNGGHRKGIHNFRVERKNGGVLLRVPGAQLIGFISTVIPKFPADQTFPQEPMSCVLEQANPSDAIRRKRSISSNGKLKKIRVLSNELFAESLDKEKLTKTLKTSEYVPSKSLEALLKEADDTQSKLSNFIDQINIQEESLSPSLELSDIYGTENIQ